MQGLTIYLSGQGIADDTNQVKNLVAYLKGKLATLKRYQDNFDLVVSEQNDDWQNKKEENNIDEFTELYETLKSSNSNYESNLKKEVNTLLHSMYPSAFTPNSTTTQITCLKTGITRKF
ncbi:predicted protein [Naegleria gruberi]|uniref:Predicted protein n=1 Tax=Naegleria gruberi TaxID=5762 RepID=D2W174_NAEGR|nr:uncharacterized protein NAEGRDRAFT_75116 [Naegleria gruberi]EFC37133.1 predicted protein [Naegleria gruberi]|eukprot:XP_002669877.1 predicted protein [Naegleria gruberi strain NEG-M]